MQANPTSDSAFDLQDGKVVEPEIIEASDEASIEATSIVLSKEIEDNWPNEINSDPLNPELDPLGGGIEMTSFTVNNRKK